MSEEAKGKKTHWGYVPLFGSSEDYRDDGSQVLISFKVHVKEHRTVHVALIGNRSEIRLLRVSIEKTENGQLSDREQRAIGDIFEHLLATLSFTYDVNVSPIYAPGIIGSLTLATLTDDGAPPSLNFKIGARLNPNWTVNPDNIARTFSKTWGKRNLIKLVADAQNPVLPIQYRYLSIYKVFELGYRQSKKWKPEFRAFLDGFAIEFQQLNLSRRSIWKFIHELRDKCAHIRLGNNSTGIIGLNSSDGQLVQKFLPLFSRMLKAHLNREFAELGVDFP